MIISASRRTDIPAQYSDWFFARIREGFACVRNPVNPHQISKIQLTPDVADGFVFWTKNPAPMMPSLHELREFAFYFQFTLTPYGKDIEPHLPVKIKLMSTFRRLADQVGADRMIWRYDPILVNQKWTVETHLQTFAMMAKLLTGATRKVIVSFVDMDYRNYKRNQSMMAAEALTAGERLHMITQLQQIAGQSGMELCTCAEDTAYAACGVKPARCVDGALFERLLGCRMAVKKDKNQRQACGCAQSVDIGMYNTCAHGCRYCYANYNAGLIARNIQKHNPASPLLGGEIGPEDTVTERRMASCRQSQRELLQLAL